MLFCAAANFNKAVSSRKLLLFFFYKANVNSGKVAQTENQFKTLSSSRKPSVPYALQHIQMDSNNQVSHYWSFLSLTTKTFHIYLKTPGYTGYLNSKSFSSTGYNLQKFKQRLDAKLNVALLTKRHILCWISATQGPMICHDMFQNQHQLKGS